MRLVTIHNDTEIHSTTYKNQIAGGHPNLKMGYASGRPPGYLGTDD